MKKVLILLGLIAVGGYFYSTRKKDSNAVAGDEPMQLQNDFFTQYDNSIVVDKDGMWMVVQNGKIFTFTDQKGLNAWQLANPENATPIVVDFPAWQQYAVNQSGGVTALPGY